MQAESTPNTRKARAAADSTPLEDLESLGRPELDWEVSPQGIRSAMLDIGDEADNDLPIVAVIDYPPACIVGVHHQQTDYVSVTVRGEITVTGHLETVGSMRFATAGTPYGPLVAGPAGCTVIDTFWVRTGMARVFAPNEGVTREQHGQMEREIAERMSALRRRRN